MGHGAQIKHGSAWNNFVYLVSLGYTLFFASVLSFCLLFLHIPRIIEPTIKRILVCAYFLYLQRERAFPPTADRDSSVDRPDSEHVVQRSTEEKNRNACHNQDRRDYERNDKYDNRELCGRKPQRKVEGTGDDTLGGPSISPLSLNDNYVLKSKSLAILDSTMLIPPCIHSELIYASSPTPPHV